MQKLRKNQSAGLSRVTGLSVNTLYDPAGMILSVSHREKYARSPVQDQDRPNNQRHGETFVLQAIKQLMANESLVVNEAMLK